MGHLVRTPGYPLFLWLIAGIGGVNFSETEIPIQNWENTNHEGRRFVKFVIFSQHILGFFIPVLLFFIIYDLFGSCLGGAVASLAYFFDLPSVCFQFVLLTETISIFLTLLSVLFFVKNFIRPSIFNSLLSGLLLGALILIKSSNMLLFIFMVTLLVFRSVYLHVFKKHIVCHLAFWGLPIIFLLVWGGVNRSTFGHFFITKNHVVTLNNFSGRHFVKLDPKDHDLQVLKSNFTEALADGEMWTLSRSFVKTATQLNMTIYDYYHLVERSNFLAITKFPREFISGGFQRYIYSWNNDFIFVMNKYAQLRFTSIYGDLAAQNKKLLFGSHSLIMFLVVSIVLLFLWRGFYERAFIVLIFVFSHSFIFLTGLLDEAEFIRHGMTVRVLINMVFLFGLYSILVFTLGRMKLRISQHQSNDG